MPYVLGAKSRAELKGVHPDLVRVVERAIQITTQDFSVHDGLRTVEEQKALVASGASQTMNSMHRPQADGFGRRGVQEIVPAPQRARTMRGPFLVEPFAGTAVVGNRQIGGDALGPAGRAILVIVGGGIAGAAMNADQRTGYRHVEATLTRRMPWRQTHSTVLPCRPC